MSAKAISESIRDNPVNHATSNSKVAIASTVVVVGAVASILLGLGANHVFGNTSKLASILMIAGSGVTGACSLAAGAVAFYKMISAKNAPKVEEDENKFLEHRAFYPNIQVDVSKIKHISKIKHVLRIEDYASNSNGIITIPRVEKKDDNIEFIKNYVADKLNIPSAELTVHLHDVQVNGQIMDLGINLDVPMLQIKHTPTKE